MKHRLLLIVLAALCAVASASGQTIRTLGYNTTNGQVVYSGTNTLTFTNQLSFIGDGNYVDLISARSQILVDQDDNSDALSYNSSSNGWTVNNPSGFRSAIGLPWSGLTNTNASGFRSALELSAGWLTNTNAANFRTAIGLGAANDVQFGEISVDNQNIILGNTNGAIFFSDSDGSETIFYFDNSADKVTARSDLDLPLPALTNTSNVTTMRALSGSTNTNHPYSGSVALTNTNVLVFSNGILQAVQ
jgi:hypothetical protein